MVCAALVGAKWPTTGKRSAAHLVVPAFWFVTTVTGGEDAAHALVSVVAIGKRLPFTNPNTLGPEKIVGLTKQLLDEIKRANAQKSTGPRSVPGKQRSRMNGVKHNLSGRNLILLEAEAEADAYNRWPPPTSMLIDLKPKSEPERQIAQKIIDTNFRLNRLTSIENNMFSFGLMRTKPTLLTTTASK